MREILGSQELRKWLITLTNVWMPFHQDTGISNPDDVIASGGCENIFSNFVVNPHGNLMSCCGLTMEYIPEMKVGHVSGGASLQDVYHRQFDDLLKLWIWLDGTRLIYDLAARRAGLDTPRISPHHCALCAEIYRHPALRAAVRDLLIENSDDIAFRSLVKARLTGRSDPWQPSERS